MPGFTTEAVAEYQDLATFAAEHDKTVAELRKTGMVAGSSLVFEPTADVEGFGLSVAAEFETDAQAVTEGNRLFAANSEPEKGSTVTALDIPGIPAHRPWRSPGPWAASASTASRSSLPMAP